MATWPAFMKIGVAVAAEPRERSAAVPETRYRLRPLPGEDVFFHCKKIDNSRLVREHDPKAAASCWSAIGAAGAVVALLAAGLIPQLLTTLGGVKLESLRAEQRRLTDELHGLQLQEAELLNMNRLEKLAKERNLTVPGPGQVIPLNGKDSSVAMNQGQ
jgi:hypothetical protein